MSHASGRALTAVVGAVALVAAPFAAAPASAEEVPIHILGINDFHGRIQALDDNDTDDPADDFGGAAMLAGVLNELRAASPDALFVSAGDNVGASPFVSAVAEDRPTIDVLNAMGLDVSAVGNHEFDRGYDWLADADSHGVDGTGTAQWPTLGANVEGETPEMPEYDLVEINQGGDPVTVGFVGVVTRQTASLVSPDGIAGITFTDPVAAANRVATDLTDGDAGNGEADVLVLLAHEGSESSDCDAVAGMPLLDGLDAGFSAVLTGHTHREYACELDGRVVVQAAEYGEAFDLIEIVYDTVAGEVVSVGAQVLANEGATPDADVAQIVADAVEDADVVGQQPIGQITQDITRAFTEDGGDDRGSESVLGNFIADVQLAATETEELGGAQIAFMNPGGLRADFEYESSDAGEGDGVVTYGEAATVQPFANGLVTMSLTGEQVRQVLEEQWQPADASRPFLALGVSEGFFFTYLPDNPAGERITSMTLDGEPLDLDATYRVTVNSFLASGGDNFETLAEGTDRQDNGFNDLNVLVDYFEENSPITPDTESRRAVGDGVDEAPAPEPTPEPTPAPTTPPTTPPATGQNPGLSVDTGVEAMGPAQTVAAGVGGLLMVVLVMAGLARRPEGERS